jgi:DNA-binding transcriptional MerR regulator
MESYDKIIYTIGDAAHIADVKPYVLRYWETEFDLLSPEKSVTGQRCYRPRDLRIVLTLKRLLHQEGFTIVGARKRLSEMSENEWAPFPPTAGSEQDLSLPPGRSVEGTVDEPKPASQDEGPVVEGGNPEPPTLSSEPEPVVSEREILPATQVLPLIVPEPQPIGLDPRVIEEMKRLFDESMRILNKYRH